MEAWKTLSQEKIYNIINQFKPCQGKMIVEKDKYYEHLLSTSLLSKLIIFPFSKIWKQNIFNSHVLLFI